MSSDMWSLLSSSPSPVPSHTSTSSDDTAATSYSVAPRIIKPEPVKPVAVPDFSLSLAHLQAALCWQPQFLQNLLALYQLQQQQTLLQQLQVILENFTIKYIFINSWILQILPAHCFLAFFMHLNWSIAKIYLAILSRDLWKKPIYKARLEKKGLFYHAVSQKIKTTQF